MAHSAAWRDPEPARRGRARALFSEVSRLFVLGAVAVALAGRFDPCAFAHNSGANVLPRELVVAGKGRFAGLAQLVVDLGGGRLSRSLPGRSRAFALLSHARVEGGAIVVQLMTAKDVPGQIGREAEGVVESEDYVARERRPLLFLGVRNRLVEQRQAAAQRATQALFLLADGGFDVGPTLHQLRIRIAQLVNRHAGDAKEEGVFHTEQDSVARGSTQHTAKNVPASFVGRKNAVPNQNRAGARMVRHDLERDIGFGASTHLDPGDLRHVRDQRQEQVGFVIAADALHHARDALEPHPGVYARGRQGHS